MAFVVTSLGAGIYTVASSSPVQGKHRVDIRALDFNGECTCDTFTQYCLFMLLNQKNRTKRQRCPHIEAARAWVLENEYPALIDQTEKIIELPTDSVVQGDDISV